LKLKIALERQENQISPGPEAAAGRHEAVTREQYSSARAKGGGRAAAKEGSSKETKN